MMLGCLCCCECETEIEENYKLQKRINKEIEKQLPHLQQSNAQLADTLSKESSEKEDLKMKN